MSPNAEEQETQEPAKVPNWDIIVIESAQRGINEIYNKDGSKEAKIPFHMGLILLGRIEWFVVIAGLDGGF